MKTNFGKKLKNYQIAGDKIEKISRESRIDIEKRKNKIKEILNLEERKNDIIAKSDDEKKLFMFDKMEHIRNFELRRMIVKEYESKVPEGYLENVEFNSDINYVLKKSKKYNNERIGINKKISIGLEIEANRRIKYNMLFDEQEGIGDYAQKDEKTIPGGIEIVSPPFYDDSEELSIFRVVCETMEEQGCYYDTKAQNASGQINLGIDFLDTKEAIINFFNIFGNSEVLLFYISNTEGQTVRNMVRKTRYCKLIGKEISKCNINPNFTREEVIQYFTASGESNYIEEKEHLGLVQKEGTICLRDGNRFEIRIPNGTVDYNVWIDNIRLYGKIMEIAKECADIELQGRSEPRDIELINLKTKLCQQNLPLEEKLQILMDLLFENNELKQIYKNRYDEYVKKLKQIVKNKSSEDDGR